MTEHVRDLVSEDEDSVVATPELRPESVERPRQNPIVPMVQSIRESLGLGAPGGSKIKDLHDNNPTSVNEYQSAERHNDGQLTSESAEPEAGPSRIDPKGKGKAREVDISPYEFEADEEGDLQQQILNSLQDSDPGLLKRVQEEARDRVYQDFLRWREAEHIRINEESKVRERERLTKAAMNKNEPIASTSGPSDTTKPVTSRRERSVAVSDSIVQRIGRIAGEEVGFAPDEGDRVHTQRPINYLAPNSHLGKILVGNKNLSDDEDPSEPDDDGALEVSSQKGEIKTKGNGEPEMKLKPIQPDKYDGAINPRRFLRFAKEAYRLVKDGRVPRKRQVDIVSHFLEGKAYSFYERTCGDCPEEWDLKDFLVQLYNFIFPLSFRTEQRKKLKNLTQHGRRIREYVGEFEDLCDITGMTEERAMVTLLWDGFDPKISAGLYNRDLHPEQSSLNDVISTAEMVELVEGVQRVNNHPRDNNRSSHSRPWDGADDERKSRPKPRFKTREQRNQDKHHQNRSTENKNGGKSGTKEE
ncbi:hypothetical protein PQX77_005422 [Marasmius sp. AFHP31]|nr:hypothetical protein PQX77_005422 [Marasmius sp. AFHP31]